MPSARTVRPRRPARRVPPASCDPWVDQAERWLRRSGVPSFVVGHARPAAVVRRWASVVGVAVAVAGSVLLAAIVAGYGAEFQVAWLQVTLVVCSLAAGVAAAAVGAVEIGLFTLRWFVRTAWRSGAGMLRILPILLVALVFTFLSAETWQSIGRLTGTPLVLATLLLVVLAVLPLLRSGDEDGAEFAGLAQARAALPAEMSSEKAAMPGRAGPPESFRPPPLSLSERVNLRLIGALGRALVAAVVGLVVTAFFCVFGVLTVGAGVTAVWTGAPPDVWWQFTVGAHQYTLSAEHVRVAMFLGVFSALYFVVSASTDRNLAESLSADTRAHVQQCLAVRMIYRSRRARTGPAGDPGERSRPVSRGESAPLP